MLFNVIGRNLSKRINSNRERKNVLILFDELPSKLNPNAYINPLAEALKLSQECNITIVSPVCLSLSLRRFKENKDRIKHMPPYRYEINSVPCWRPRYIEFSILPWKLNKYYIQIFSMLISLLFLIYSKRIRFDIIHANFVYRPGYVAAILGKLLRKPVIIHAIGSDIHQNLSQREERGLFRRRTIKAMIWCTRIIAVSGFLKKLIDEEGFSDKTVVNPRGYSIDLFPPMDKMECRKELFLNTESKILLFVGNLVTVKGVDILIEAFKLLSGDLANLELIIVGDGPEKDALELQMRKIGLERWISFVGAKTHATIPLYFNACDILVVPSRNEGLSLVTIEALACGKPVVACRVGAIGEILSNERLGILVEKENPQALANGILKALIRSWDSEYQQNFVKQFTNDRLVEKVIKVYDDVLDRT